MSDKRGWLIADGNFNFPRTLSVTPCKKFSCEDKECTYERRCSFFHGRFPQNYKKPDRTLIADWVKTTRNVKYSGQVDMSKLERSFNETNDGENNSANADTTTANGVDSISAQTFAVVVAAFAELFSPSLVSLEYLSSLLMST